MQEPSSENDEEKRNDWGGYCSLPLESSEKKHADPRQPDRKAKMQSRRAFWGASKKIGQNIRIGALCYTCCEDGGPTFLLEQLRAIREFMRKVDFLLLDDL